MADYSIWGVIRQTPDGRYRVRVRAIALQSRGGFVAEDELTRTVGDWSDATAIRDELVETLKKLLLGRGETVTSVDTTIEA
jgi:hypothetical protein